MNTYTSKSHAIQTQTLLQCERCSNIPLGIREVSAVDFDENNELRYVKDQ